MSKIFKTIIWIIIVAVVLLVLVVGGLVLFVNPNKYKDTITQQVQKKTGQTIQLNGAMSWKIFPRLGLELNNVRILSNPAVTQQPLADVKQLSVSVKLLPLLARDIEVDAISLKQPVIHLVKNKNGEVNWAMHSNNSAVASTVQQQTAPQTGDANKPEVSDQATESSVANNSADSQVIKPLQTAPVSNGNTQPTKPLMKTNAHSQLNKLSIAKLTIDNGQLDWSDQQTGQHIVVNNLEFKSSDIKMGSAFPIATQFVVQSHKQMVKVALQTQAMLQVNEYDLRDINFKIDDSTLTGKMNINMQQGLAAKFNLAIDKLDINRYIQFVKGPAQSADANSIQQLPEVNAKASFLPEAFAAEVPVSASNDNQAFLPIEFLKQLKLEGSLAVKQLHAAKVSAENVSAEIKAKEGVIKISPLKGNVYGGEFSNDVTLDVRGEVPTLHAKEHGTNVQVAPLLNDVIGTSRVTGVMNFNADIDAQMASPDTIIPTLNGSLAFDLSDGKVEGVNIPQIINTAVAIFRREPPLAASEGNATEFGTLTLRANVKNGVVIIDQDNLTLDSAIYNIKGMGSADLVKQLVNLRIGVNVKGDVNKYIKELQEKAGGIPLRVQGSFAKFIVVPDTVRISEAATKVFLEEKTERLQERFRNIFKNLNE
ncbi:MAG: AsmA family protein [Gammaproteobacteria bacterium]